jgi:predicted DNA-binding ribbon-helix-helix protein
MPRKLIEFHAEDLRALTELAEDRSTSLQELIDEAIRDLLRKHGKPTNLKTALRESAKVEELKPRGKR